VDHTHLTSKQNAVCGCGCEWSRLTPPGVTLTLHAHGHTGEPNVTAASFAALLAASKKLLPLYGAADRSSLCGRGLPAGKYRL
jgi:hypothetical protein